MPFSIEFLDQPLQYLYEDPTTPGAIGRVVFGKFEEEFASSLFTWSKLDYERQWRSAVRSLLGGEHKAALIVEYVDPKFSSQLEWWPLYRFGPTVFVQNQLLFFEDIDRPFSVDDAFSFLNERRTLNEDGEALSEWRVELAEIEQFAHELSL